MHNCMKKLNRWEQFITQDENKQAQAECTQTFWDDCPAKISVSCQSRVAYSYNYRFQRDMLQNQRFFTKK